MSLYSKWHRETSGVDELVLGFRLTSNRYIARESANIKYVSNGLFEETYEQRIFSKVFYY